MKAARPLPGLHLVTDDAILADPLFTDRATALLRLGGTRIALHLRGPRTGGRRLFEMAETLAAEAGRSGAMLLVNDRVDVAIAAQADGVQLGRRSLGAGEVRRLLGSDRWIGCSVHTAVEAKAALAEGADFLLAGTLFASASHPEEAATGTGWLREIPGAAERVIGIGGITPERVGAVLAGPAHGVAVMRAVFEAERPAEAMRELLNGLHGRGASE